VGSLDLPDQPDEPMPTRQADAGGSERSTHRSRELPDPDERSRAYEAARAKVSAETPAEASPDRQPDAGDQGRYWNEVPRFLETWSKHENHWRTKRAAAVDRSADPDGSYRSDGGFFLNPVRHAQTIEAIREVRRVERSITADIRTTERENTYGCWLEGFKNRLKGDDRLKEKVAEGLATADPDARPEEIISQIPDAIRYTFCGRLETYTRAYYDIKGRLENLGYEMYQSKNLWDDAEYKGINTRWVTPEGQRFEIQFHTPESFHAKQYVTHRAYERLRNPLTRDAERPALEDFQRDVSAWIQVPVGAREIPDFKKEGF
jgi:hypothetical protein